MSAASIVDKRTPKWHDQGKALRSDSTGPADEKAAALHAKYRRVCAVRLGIRFAGDPVAAQEVRDMLGLVTS